jgi:hypothetical protein
MDPQPQAADSLVDLLDQLQDIVEPPPVSMLPATWGWAVVVVLLLAAAAVAAWAWLRHRRATAYRRAALAELRALAPALERGDPGSLVTLERLLRRTALAAFPRAEVATLTGDAWLAFLDRTGGGFARFGPALATAAYAPAPQAVDDRAVLLAARHWIARHHA